MMCNLNKYKLPVTLNTIAVGGNVEIGTLIVLPLELLEFEELAGRRFRFVVFT